MDKDWAVPSTDPRKFNDPFALEIGWESISGEASNITFWRLKEAGPGQMKFVTTGAAAQFCFGFILLGLFLMAIASYEFSLGRHHQIFPALLGIGFAAFGATCYYLTNNPIVFDRQSGFFWKGRGQPYQDAIGGKSPKTAVPLSQIYALQLITKRILVRAVSNSPGSGANYLCYELDLVLKDKTRIGVVDNGEIASAKEDAKILANFLSVPLWDAAMTETECLPPDAPLLRRTVAQAADNRDKLIRYAAIPQALLGAFLLFAGYWVGKVNLPVPFLQKGFLAFGAFLVIVAIKGWFFP